MARIRIDSDLLERARAITETAGYASVEEFVAHAIEKELANREPDQSEEEVTKRLRGLGYIE